MKVKRDRNFHDKSVRNIIFSTNAVPGTQPVYGQLVAAGRFLVKRDPRYSHVTTRSLTVRSIGNQPLTGRRLPYGNFHIKRDSNTHDTFIITRSARI